MKFMLLILLMLSLCKAYGQQTLTLASGEWSPFISQDAANYGYVSDIVSEAFKTVGIDVNYEFYPWARSEDLVKHGDIRGSIVWIQTAERDNFAYFSDTIITQESVLFHLKSKPIAARTFADIKDINIVVPIGYSLGVWEKPIESGHVLLDRTPNLKTGFRQILVNRMDAFPVIKDVGYHVLRRYFTPEQRAKITHAPMVLERIEYRLMLSQKHEQNIALLKRFNQGLARFKNSSRYQQMEKAFQQGFYD